MNKIDFETKLKTASPVVDRDYTKKLFSACFDFQGADLTYVRCMEEFAELSQVLSKCLRHKEDRSHLLEELADSQMSIYMLQQLCGISDDELNRALNVKLKCAEDGIGGLHDNKAS